MNKHTIGITALGIFLAVVCIFSLTQINSPVTQRNINLDENRIRDFQEIEYMMENHVRKTGSLPPTLEALDVTPRTTEEAKDILTDPVSKVLYDYEPIAATTYQLCTTFATDSAASEDGQVSIKVNTRFEHAYGYDCVQLTLSKDILSPTPSGR